MTGPVTTEAFAEARELVRQSLKGGAPGLTEATREAVVGSIMLKITNKVLAPLLAALQQVTAERDEARAENDRFRAGLANGSGPCAYCNLSREDWTKCRSGFPGCDRADDAMLCPHFGAEMEANDRADAATSELARLRAEGEDLREDAARLDFLDGCNARLNASYGTHYGWKLVLNHNVNRLVLGDMKVDLHDSEGGNDKLPSCRLAIDEARKRTALARAATAREGQADE